MFEALEEKSNVLGVGNNCLKLFGTSPHVLAVYGQLDTSRTAIMVPLEVKSMPESANLGPGRCWQEESLIDQTDRRI
jgi:hypothetical protein